MIYNSRPEVLEALRLAPKGAKRADILAIDTNRHLIESSGASVTLYCGEVKQGETIKQQLNEVFIGLIARVNAKTGKPDGIGALGGLSERTAPEEFAQMFPTQRKEASQIKDDIIIENNEPKLTSDIDIIRLNNVQRETKEELGNLGIHDYLLNIKDIHLIEMPNIKDDNFAINIWDGQETTWAITPYVHTLKVNETILDNLSLRSKDKRLHETNAEVANFSKIPLFEALKRYGNRTGADKLEDGRNAKTDYRYPHEWLGTWALASDLLEHDDKSMLELMKEVQKETPWKISFKSIADKLGKDLNFIAEVLQVKPETMLQMENIRPTPASFITALKKSHGI